jgi:LDH2 family malate/lactate/ureidoglycolate dehydrogenase
LAGTLNGAAMGRQVIDFNKDFSTTTNTGQAIAIIDPSAFGEITEFKQNVDTLVRELRGSDRMPGVDRIWLPGEQSHEKRLSNEAHGIVLAPSLMKQLNDLAAQLNIKPLNVQLQT